MGNRTHMTRIVCLANSRKQSGRCVAGKELSQNGFGRWIRPVSDRPTREVLLSECRYLSGENPKLLDIVDVPLLERMPEGHQQENFRFEPNAYWEKRGRLDWHDLLKGVDELRQGLWIDGFSSFHGLNDRVPEAQLASLGSSLYLLHPEVLLVSVRTEQGYENRSAKRRVRVFFRLGNSEYCLVLTDPVEERHYLRGPDREVEVRNALLCVSLGELYHGYAYKLVAAIIQRDTA